MTVTRRHGRIPRVPAAFIMTESAVRAAVRPPGLVVLRAARGFGKTATLASWLRSDRFAGYDSIWVPLSAPTEPGSCGKRFERDCQRFTVTCVASNPR